MRDPTVSPPRPPHAPQSWHDAFAALPPETPEAGGWTRLQARLALEGRPAWIRRSPARWATWRPRSRWIASGLAAALALALVLPGQLSGWRDPRPPSRDSRDGGSQSPVDALRAESAELEAWLGYVRDERVSSATAAALAGEYESRLAGIDGALAAPGLTPYQERQLWQARVQLLHGLAELESTRRWLALNGQRLDGTLVLVD